MKSNTLLPRRETSFTFLDSSVAIHPSRPVAPPREGGGVMSCIAQPVLADRRQRIVYDENEDISTNKRNVLAVNLDRFTLVETLARSPRRNGIQLRTRFVFRTMSTPPPSGDTVSPRVNVARDLSLPSFHGRSDEDGKRWLQLFLRFAECHGWSDPVKLSYIPFYLRNTASTWFNNFESSFTSWTHFVHLFTQS
jgi:hypothetical protein